MKGMSGISMPLDEFMEKEWKGLMEGKEQVPVGMAEVCYEAFENKRQEVFKAMLRR